MVLSEFVVLRIMFEAGSYDDELCHRCCYRISSCYFFCCQIEEDLRFSPVLFLVLLVSVISCIGNKLKEFIAVIFPDTESFSIQPPRGEDWILLGWLQAGIFPHPDPFGGIKRKD